MKKKYIAVLMCLLTFCIFNCSTLIFKKDYVVQRYVNAVSNYKTENNTDENVVLILLYDNIDKAIQDYYGRPTQFALYDSKITKSKQIGNEFSYILTVEVPTFSGPHNPPYGLEILTFSVSPGKTVLKSYEHKEIAL